MVWEGAARLAAAAAILAAPAPLSSAAVLVPGVPPEVELACGHPGAHARISRAILAPLRIRHRDCDLRGVTLEGLTVGVTVPYRSGGAQATNTGLGLEETVTVHVARRTLDVTVADSVAA
jgi:hypothetical protein